MYIFLHCTTFWIQIQIKTTLLIPRKAIHFQLTHAKHTPLQTHRQGSYMSKATDQHTLVNTSKQQAAVKNSTNIPIVHIAGSLTYNVKHTR